MAKIKNVSGDAWVDAETNTRVAKGGTLEIPDGRAWGYCQMESIWKAADKATAELAEEQRAAIAALENPGPVVDEAPVEPAVVPENVEG